MGLFNWLFGRRARPAKHPVAPASAETTVSYGAPAFAVVDVETTGLSPQRDRVLEVAIVRLDATGAVVDEWVTRIDPEGPVGAIHIHGIRQADVVGRPRFADVAGTIVARLSGLAVVAHNAKFDLAFLRNELKSAGWDVPWIAAYCTLDASYAYLPDMDRRRLADCCWAVGVRLDDAHSALGDARAAAGLLGAYVGLNGGPDPVLTEAQDLARSTRWPSGPSRSPSRSASASVVLARRQDARQRTSCTNHLAPPHRSPVARTAHRDVPPRSTRGRGTRWVDGVPRDALRRPRGRRHLRR